MKKKKRRTASTQHSQPNAWSIQFARHVQLHSIIQLSNYLMYTDSSIQFICNNTAIHIYIYIILCHDGNTQCVQTIVIRTSIHQASKCTLPSFDCTDCSSAWCESVGIKAHCSCFGRAYGDMILKRKLSLSNLNAHDSWENRYIYIYVFRRQTAALKIVCLACECNHNNTARSTHKNTRSQSSSEIQRTARGTHRQNINKMNKKKKKHSLALWMWNANRIKETKIDLLFLFFFSIFLSF